WTPIFRTPDEVVVDVVGCVPGLFAHSNLIISRERKGGQAPFPTGLKPGVPWRNFYGNRAADAVSFNYPHTTYDDINSNRRTSGRHLQTSKGCGYSRQPA